LTIPDIKFIILIGNSFETRCPHLGFFLNFIGKAFRPGANPPGLPVCGG